jgi:Uma2 family endonuclease
MTTLTAPTSRPVESLFPQLEAGDHLDQPTFHERYKAMPEDVRAELIGGIVVIPSPLRLNHGTVHAKLIAWLVHYEMMTPGARAADNATDILGRNSEPQPDAMLFIEGGPARENDEGYVVGPPEFIAEVATSSISYDLHSKKADYERHGVREYLVLSVLDHRAFWFVREGETFVELPADTDGIHRSRILPGLWFDSAAMFRGDLKRMLEVLNLGLQTPEHAAFVATRTQS